VSNRILKHLVCPGRMQSLGGNEGKLIGHLANIGSPERCVCVCVICCCWLGMRRSIHSSDCQRFLKEPGRLLWMCKIDQLKN